MKSYQTRCMIARPVGEFLGAARLVARKGSVAHRQQLPDRFRVAMVLGSWLSPLSVGCGGGEREQQEPAIAGKQEQSELS